MSTPSTPVRLQRRRTKGFRLESPNGLKIVCVTRPGFWGNIFIGEDAARLFDIAMHQRWGELNLTLRGIGQGVSVLGMEAIKSYVRDRIDHIDELRGFNLACFCALRKKCHAQTLLELANAPAKSEGKGQVK